MTSTFATVWEDSNNGSKSLLLCLREYTKIQRRLANSIRSDTCICFISKGKTCNNTLRAVSPISRRGIDESRKRNVHSGSTLQLLSNSMYSAGTGPVVGPHLNPAARTSIFRPIYCNE